MLPEENLPGAAFLEGGGEMGALIRSIDWSETPLKEPESWPYCLKLAVSLMLYSPFPMYIAWGKEYIQLYNDAYRPILGKSKHPEAMGISSRETFAEIWDQLGPMFAGVMVGEAVFHPDFLYVLERNGYPEECYFDFSYSPIRDEYGSIGGVLVICMETTDKVLSRRKLEESESRFRIMAEASDILIAVGDETGNGTYFSKAWVELTGRRMSDLLKFGWADRVHPEDKERYVKIYLDALAVRAPFTGEFRILNKNGNYRWLLARGAPRFENETFAGYISSCIDITERRQSELGMEAMNEELAAANEELLTTNEELSELHRKLQDTIKERDKSEAKFREAIKQAPVAMAIFDGPEMMVESINDAMLEIWAKPASVAGKPLVEALPELKEHGQPFLKILDDVYASGTPFNGTEVKGVIHKDGEIKEGYFDFVFQPFKNEQEQTTSIMEVAIDVTERVNARKDLERAYEQARLSKHAALLGTFDMDLEKGTMEWDERCRTLFGISHQDIVTYEKDFVKGLHPDDRERVLDVIDKVMDKSISNGDYDIEYRTVGAEDKQLRWVRAKGKAYFNDDDKPVRFIGSVLDITDQKTDEIRLKESAERQARLAAIVNTSDDTIVSKTLAGIITSWNASAERMFGYNQNEAIGKHISLIIPPERLKEEEYIISQISAGNRVEHFETMRLAKDGRQIPVSISVSPIVDADGKVIGASKIARDISVQQFAKSTAKQYTERLEIINQMIQMVSEELDLNKIVQKITDATVELTGAKFGAFFYNKIDENGESYMLYTLSGAPREAFEKFGMPRNTAVFHATFSGQGVVRVDDITKDPRYGKSAPHYGMPKGHLPVVSYLAVPVISRSGEVIGGLFFGHPEPGKFTEEHESLVASIAAQSAIGMDNAKLYEEVKTLNEKKDEFIGLASHELKTPLTSISGYLQILSRMRPDEASQRFLDKTRQQVKKLTTLVNDLLDVSKIEAGQLQLSIEEFDLKKVLEDTIELIRHSNEKYNITLSADTQTCLVHADAPRIEQVVINLLTNAIKYSPGTDKVEMFLICKNNEVKVGIKDFGLGIPADKLSQIFSRFYRVQEATPNISGLGIGLYLSKEIISRHNGRLWAESEVGKGSTFWFSLPLKGPI